MSKRSKEKYPNLKKEFNLPSRQHLIDQEYIDGVYDNQGNCLIRGLNEEEKAWLDKFNSEWVNVDFYTNDEVKAHEEITNIIAQENNPKRRDFILYTYHLIIVEYLKDDVFLQNRIQRKECSDMNNWRNNDVLHMAITRQDSYPLHDEIYMDDDGTYKEVNDSSYSLEYEFDGFTF
ncbi:hypothetical protein [Nocardia mangyaensis]|uniref:hypothetical protein n=1 Tax=Nocardia mangyaensis TaxID=2213200 RepID=UPI002676C927|nr:hypothetical protein [Nocardia mangyaensis]MDO3651287.1 hypothetical protein [Nocardia mangyaensis]